MTAEPLTAAEAEVVARFDAAPPAEESAVERVARAMWADQYPFDHWDSTQRGQRDHYRRLATAALTEMRPAPDTAKADEGAALRKVLADLVEAVGRGDEHGLPEAYRAARTALDAAS